VSNVGPPSQPTAPPPGWYPDPTGTQRWWDGWQWGPAAPPRSETAEGKSLALVAHLGVLAGGFLLPLVLRLTEGRKNAFVRHHATEALNFQITFMLVWFTGFGLLIGTTFGEPTGHTTQAPPAVYAIFLAMALLFVANVVFSILGCVRASQERWWRYPLSIRFVRGAAPRERAGGNGQRWAA
jgi:uncharacterized Tic20 family protein